MALNKWLKEEDFRKPGDLFYPTYDISKKKYGFGFHVYTDEPNPNYISYIVKTNCIYELVDVKVLFRYIVAKGLQMSSKCVVAKEIFIPKDQFN